MRKTITAMMAGVAFGAMLPKVITQSTAQDTAPTQRAKTTYEYLDNFGEIFERVRAEYVEPVEDQKLIEAEIEGMLTALDAHSSYLPTESFRDMREQTRGEFGGLGSEGNMEDGYVKVECARDC